MSASLRTAGYTLAASIGLHGLLLLLAAWFIAVLPVSERERKTMTILPALARALLDDSGEPETREVEVSFLSIPPDAEKLTLKPAPAPPPASPPSGRMTIRPREDQPALAPLNSDTPFISHQNMRAAATSAPKPGADPNMINQEGHDGPGLSLTTTGFIPGSDVEAPPDSPDPVAATESQPPPPPPQNDRPPDPVAVVKTEDPLAPAPATKPAESLTMRESPPETLTITKAAEVPARPKTSAAPPRDPVSARPDPGKVRRTPVLSSVKSKSAGALAIRGDQPSLDARDTPEGRYNNSVYEQVGLLWNSRLATVRGLAGMGTVEVEFEIDLKGRVSNVRLVDPGKANPVLEDVCLTSIIKAKLPAPPVEMLRELGDPLSGGKLHRKFTFHRL